MSSSYGDKEAACQEAVGQRSMPHRHVARHLINNAPVSCSDLLSSPRLLATPNDQCTGQGHYPVESGHFQPFYDPAKVHVLNRDREGAVTSCLSTGHPGLHLLSRLPMLSHTYLGNCWYLTRKARGPSPHTL